MLSQKCMKSNAIPNRRIKSEIIIITTYGIPKVLKHHELKYLLFASNSQKSQDIHHASTDYNL